jgi:hypothetical protein
MPVRKVGPNSYQWGTSGKIYTGKNAKAKAERQGRAIYASGYKGAESYKPPASAIANAKRGLKLRKEWGRGGLSPSEAAAQGIDSGVTRARKIASGTVSRHDVRRMSAFNRHRKNYRPEKKMSDGGPTAGTIAWLLWGGTSGVNWAKKKSAAMDAETFGADEERCPMPLGFWKEPCGKRLYGRADGKLPRPSIGRKTQGMMICPDCASRESYAQGLGEWVDKYGNGSRLDAETFEAQRYQKQKQCAVCLDIEDYNKMMSCFVCGQNYCAACEKYDSCAEYSSEDWGGDPDGPLAKALAQARESLKQPRKPLQITRLPDPDQKTLKDFEANYRPCQKCDNRYKSDCECYCAWCKKDTPLFNVVRGEWVCENCKKQHDEEPEDWMGADWQPHFYGNCDECKQPMMLGVEIKNRYGFGETPSAKICQECDYVVCGSCYPQAKNCINCNESFEANWQDLPRNKLGQWQRPVSITTLNNLIATTPGVPKLSELLNLYGGDTPNNRVRLYNDMLTLRITTEDFEDDIPTFEESDAYAWILEEPLDVVEENPQMTPEYWDRYIRHLGMTSSQTELESRLENLMNNLDLFSDEEEQFAEISMLMAALRQQKFMEKYQAE